jgi:hypothetical protein
LKASRTETNSTRGELLSNQSANESERHGENRECDEEGAEAAK